ncbi:MAG: RdgB/HAM1 family non-canonical purine NTP pyrophosphatase [Neisseriaceae bacterium]|jgi:XTP/dITP diphosphohydrolase
MKQIVLASNNQGKLDEFNAIFKNSAFEIIPQSKFNVTEIDEPYFTFIENALHKARHCSKFTNLPVLADDSGICANALGGRPGVYSARFAGIPTNSKNNCRKLVEELEPFTDKSAYFCCTLVLIRHYHDPQPIISDGILKGQIIDHPRGNNGFGYDPHLLLPQFNKTVAELDPAEKNKLSHRYLAIQNLLQKINNIL